MPTAIACGECYYCPCGAWRWVELAQTNGEKKCTKCGRLFRAEDIGMRRLGQRKERKVQGAEPKRRAQPKAKAKAKAAAQTGPQRPYPWTASATGLPSGGGGGGGGPRTKTPTKPQSAQGAGSGDRADVLRDTLALLRRHGYSDERSEVVAAQAELDELLRERQARLPLEERVKSIQTALRSVQEELARREAEAQATEKEVARLRAQLAVEEVAIDKLQVQVADLGADLAEAQKDLPASKRPIPVGQYHLQSCDLEEDLDMQIGRVEERFQKELGDDLDETAKTLLRDYAGSFSTNLHELRGRLRTNAAERRHRERKRQEAGDAADMEEDEGGFQLAQRRRGSRVSSATGGPAPITPQAGSVSPRRAGTPATGGATGSLSGAAAAGTNGAGGTAGPPNGRGDGSART